MEDAQMLTEAIHAWMRSVMQFSMRGFLEFAKTSGISIPQLGALIQISKNHCHGVTGLGEGLGVTSAAASQMLDRLVQQGYVERTEDPEDRRSKTIRLTPKGETTIKEGVDARQNWIPSLVRSLRNEEKEEATAVFTMITAKMKELESSYFQKSSNKGVNFQNVENS